MERTLHNNWGKLISGNRGGFNTRKSSSTTHHSHGQKAAKGAWGPAMWGHEGKAGWLQRVAQNVHHDEHMHTHAHGLCSRRSEAGNHGGWSRRFKALAVQEKGACVGWHWTLIRTCALELPQQLLKSRSSVWSADYWGTRMIARNPKEANRKKIKENWT